MSHVSRITIVLNADGSFSNAAIHESEVVGGKTYDLDPRAIYADNASALEPYLGSAASAAIAALEERDATIAAHAPALQALTAERDAALAQVAEIKALLASGTGEEQPAETDENGVPIKVPMAAGRIAMSRAGVLSRVKAALAAMQGQQGEEAREWFEYSSHIERRHPTVLAMTPLVGTSADVDALFVAAAAISSEVGGVPSLTVPSSTLWARIKSWVIGG